MALLKLNLLGRNILVKMRTMCSINNVVVVTDDGSTFVSWHPKQDFPYECTRPLPETLQQQETSVLKTKLTPELLEVLRKKTPDQARQELMSITHTTKHRWFPRARDRRAKKTPVNREYL